MGYNQRLMKWFYGAFFAVLLAVGLGALIWWNHTPRPDTVSQQDAFRFPLFSEPHSLDPLKESSTTARYLMPNLHRGLLMYTEGELVLVGAEKCEWVSELLFVCNLKPNFKYATGEEVRAEDYLRSFHQLLNPAGAHPLAELLFPLQNARKVLTGEAPPSELGAVAKDPLTLEFYLEAPMGEFPYHLAHPVLAPRPQASEETYLTTSAPEQAPLTGPFKVKKWLTGRKAELIPNPYYPFEGEPPLPVELLFVEDDATNRRLYEQGRVDWLRRVATHLIPAHSEDPAFRQVPLARFDYVGFGPELKDRPLLRKALAHALDYEELALIYHALGRPGCPSLPRSYLEEVPCYSFDLDEAKRFLQRHLEEEEPLLEVELAYSKLGGDDVEKGMTWMAEQWRKNLGLRVHLEPLEQGQMLHRLWQQLPGLFRKGVSLDRPTCAAGLEVLMPQGSERFLDWEPPAEFEEVLQEMTASADKEEKKELCTRAVRLLLSTYALIPLGEIHYSMLISPKFLGVEINELNQLNLTELRKAE